jgi:multiple sugar transport system permease protein
VTTRSRFRHTIGQRSLDALTYLVIFLFLAPILWLVSTAFKTRTDAFAIPPIWFFRPTLANFEEVIRRTDFLSQYRNSIVVAAATTVITLLLGVPAAYALSRFRFRGQRPLAFWILTTRLLPVIGMLFPLYVIFNRLRLLDTYQGLILLHVTFALVVVIWMMRGYFMQVPIELEEAALVDGATRLRALIRIVVPLAAPGMAAVSVFTFIISWNEFLFALIFTRSQVQTAPVALLGFMSFEGINWGPLAAAGLMILAPVFLFSLFVLKYLVAGLSMGAVKD